jgi:ketosteroid isomerase-like protein
MSQQDLELVRALNRAFNERDRDWVDYYSPDAEVRVPPGWLENRVFMGHRDIEEVAGLWTETVREYRWEIEQLIDGIDCVVGLCRFSSRINRGGNWLSPPLGMVLHVRDGKVTHVRAYFSWEEALAVAGIRQPG